MTQFLKKFQNVTFLVSAREKLRINFDWAVGLDPLAKKAKIAINLLTNNLLGIRKDSCEILK